MARASRKKYYRKYTPRTKWSSNIKQLGENLGGDQNINVPANEYFYLQEDLCENPPPAPNTVSQIYTVKNIEVTIELTGRYVSSSQPGTSTIENLQYYIMFLPQGMVVSTNYAQDHPEYIMAYSFIGSPTIDTNATSSVMPPRKVKTRLARRLNTGDKIILFIRGVNPSSAGQTFELHGMVRWWTKAN